MIEELAVQYGTLGMWVAYMIYKERTYMKNMKIAIDNNTKALNKFNNSKVK